MPWSARRRTEISTAFHSVSPYSPTFVAAARYEGTLHGRKVELYNDTLIALKDRRELFRTTVEEPVHVRSNAHANSI